MPPAPRAGMFGTRAARGPEPHWHTRASAVRAFEPGRMPVNAGALRSDAPKLWYKFAFESGRLIHAGMIYRRH